MAKMKATVITHKNKFVQKVISFRKEIRDAYYKNMKSYCTVFIPKLTPEYLTPVVMLNVSNARASTLIRFKNPKELSKILIGINEIINGELWNNAWENIIWNSENMLENGRPVILDKQFFTQER